MRIFDPLHGFIHFNEWETELVDSKPFQRLRQIHQLGNCFLIYPGATHRRFEHSLGVMELSSRIFDRLDTKIEDAAYWKQIIRLAALCHDLGHLPFSHTAEERFLGRGGHELLTERIIRGENLASLWDKLSLHFPGRMIVEDLVKIAIGKEGLAQIITSDLFGADRIDYLLRDARMTGLSYGLFDYMQLIESLRFEKGDIQIAENGKDAAQALLLAHHFMQKRLYHYPPVKACEFHLARFMQKLYRHHEDPLSMSEAEIQWALERTDDDLDARCLKVRSLRFKAIALPPDVEEASLQAFKKKFSITDECIEWELYPNNWLYLSPEYSFLEYNCVDA